MIVLISKDLMFASTISQAAKAAGQEFALVASGGSAVKRCAAHDVSQVIVDLVLWNEEVAAAVAEVKQDSPAVQVIAYGPHVQTEQLAAAARAGCDQVLTRGEFHARLQELLAAATGRRLD